MQKPRATEAGGSEESSKTVGAERRSTKKRIEEGSPSDPLLPTFWSTGISALLFWNRPAHTADGSPHPSCLVEFPLLRHA
ncbi:hypothetical protein GCM10010222_75290 [Streptomyces tanashiensis]|nr:hypothetical protein GCM10010222_75290 [Streptomyces tanashiensis]